MAENFQSNFVFGLQGNLYQDFCDNIAHPIIQNIIGSDDYEIITFEKHLSLLDFDKSKRKKSIFPEFYLNFLGDIIKESNSVSFKKKICITLDDSFCNKTCPNTGRKIATIKLGGVELACFIYFDIKEFFNFVYGKNINTKIETKEQHLPLHQRLGYNNQDELYSVLRSSKKLVALLESLGANIPTKQGKVDLIPAVSKDDKEFLELLNHKNPNVRDVVQAKLDMQFNRLQDDTYNNYLVVKKIGYIHNINNERGLSFVHETKDGDIGFPIYYQDFPEVEKFPIGTPIKAFGCLHNDKFYVDNYEVVDVDELPFQLIRLNGTLKIFENSTFAIIRTSIGGVYTSLDLIQKYAPNIIHQVECVAIEAYDHKRQENGWRAIWVGDNTALNQEYTQRFD